MKSWKQRRIALKEKKNREGDVTKKKEGGPWVGGRKKERPSLSRDLIPFRFRVGEKEGQICMISQ